MIIALLVAFIAGIIMAVQGSLNAALGKIIGLLESTFLVHITGTLVVLTALYLLRLGKGDLNKVTEAPWYFYLGGLLGVVIVYGVVVAIPRLGVATATTAIIVGQVSTALLIDQLGLFGLEKIPFSWVKGLGVIFLAAGAKLMLMK